MKSEEVALYWVINKGNFSTLAKLESTNRMKKWILHFCFKSLPETECLSLCYWFPLGGNSVLKFGSNNDQCISLWLILSMQDRNIRALWAVWITWAVPESKYPSKHCSMKSNAEVSWCSCNSLGVDYVSLNNTTLDDLCHSAAWDRACMMVNLDFKDTRKMFTTSFKYHFLEK